MKESGIFESVALGIEVGGHHIVDDETFEQIKKQLNRMVEVIKVIDFTDVFVRMKEILYVKVLKCTPEDKVEIFRSQRHLRRK